ncbi:MAG: hypothetical protein ACOVP8_08270 [Phycisphaerales bacterium]
MTGEQWIKLALLIACPLLAAVAMVAWWGDGNHRKRRCGACGYDMANAKSRKCPECGHEAASEFGMYGPRPYRAVMKWSLVLLCITLPVLVWSMIPTKWNRKTPGPILKIFLATVPDAPRSSSGITAPAAQYANSADPWHREIWADQSAQALRDAIGIVRAQQGDFTPEQLVALLPAMRELREINRSIGALPWKDAWQYMDVVDDLADLRQETCAKSSERDDCVRLTWLLSEISVDAGVTPFSHRLAVPPASVVRAAFAHSDPAIRLEAVDWYGRLLHVQLMNPKFTAPDFEPELRAAVDDANPALATRAKSLIIWGAGLGFLGAAPAPPPP